MAQRYATLEIAKEYMKFSVAHFTIFSAIERERLHGHNYAVAVRLSLPVGENGMCFSYGLIKDKVSALCETLDEYLVLPGNSPYLKVSEGDDEVVATFGNEVHRYLRSDTLVLPISNTTVEEFSRYLLEQLMQDSLFAGEHRPRSVELKVASGPGQWGYSQWPEEGGSTYA